MTSPTTQQAEGLTFAAYPGDGAVLLAFDVDQSMAPDLAGFAVEYTDPDGQTLPVLNRLGSLRRSPARLRQNNASSFLPVRLRCRSSTGCISLRT